MYEQQSVAKTMALICLFLIPSTALTQNRPSLGATQFDSKPYNFSYKPGKITVLTYYPARLGSKENAAFNRRLLDKGICSVNLVSLENKEWYAPKVMVLREMRKQVEKSADPSCVVSADVNNTIKSALNISDEPTVIVLDKSGHETHRFEGVLSEEEQSLVIHMVEQDHQPNLLNAQNRGTQTKRSAK